MEDILFFSNNNNKIIEISNLFFNEKIKILNLNDFKEIESPKEVGKTFEENAKIKSLFGLMNFGKMCFADDSGICIESIMGGPGVNSKQFLLSEKKNLNVFDNIINKCKKKNNFNAFFQTTICLSINKDKHIYFTGMIKGKISKKVRGSEGFGYDPIFIPNGHKATFAEMKVNEKNKISHRAIATIKLKKFLISI